MRRLSAALGSLFFLLVAPGTVAVLLPWWISRWRVHASFLGLPALRAAGLMFVALALPLLLDSFVRFALEGEGTPAPVFPTRHLVVAGAYRHVRNPIYLAVFSLIVGQALLLGNTAVLEYAALVGLGFHLFVVMYEEPTLRAAFGAEYEVFCANVPRWIPRLRPWRGGARP